ncbi:MAG: hypothetical protein IPI28_01405 [Candidatus Omnitrophica bacterium]|nr:hypothetical protein [Candidatus Omnitrophota bacterium]
MDQFGLGKIAATIRETRGRIYLLEGRDKFARNDVSEALDLYDKCLQVNPEEALAYLDRSRIYYEQDFFQDAIADLEMALEILGQNPEILSLVQRLKIEAGKKGQTLSDQDAFFILESPGANPSQDQVLKRVLKDIRLSVARNLTVNPKTPWWSRSAGVNPLFVIISGFLLQGCAWKVTAFQWEAGRLIQTPKPSGRLSPSIMSAAWF